jgi:hypothetical protein
LAGLALVSVGFRDAAQRSRMSRWPETISAHVLCGYQAGEFATPYALPVLFAFIIKLIEGTFYHEKARKITQIDSKAT